MTTKVIAIANQKGGVGKTTTTASLGTALSRMGYQVLLIDSDPQGSLTASFGYTTDANSITLSTIMRQVITGEPISTNCIIRHESERIDLIPADISLAGIESTLVNVSVDREYVLKDFLENTQSKYDYILIDCMPSLGMLTVNALVAAHSVLIPVQAAYLSAKGLEQLLATVGRIKKRLNPALQIDGILMTMVDSRTNNARDVSGSIKAAYGQQLRIFGTSVPRSVRAEESPAAGKSVLVYDPDGKVTSSYIALAREVTA